MSQTALFAALCKNLREGRSVQHADLALALRSDDPGAMKVRIALAFALENGLTLTPTKKTMSPEERVKLDAWALDRYEHYMNLDGPQSWAALFKTDKLATPRPDWARKKVSDDLYRERGEAFAPNTIKVMVTRARNRPAD